MRRWRRWAATAAALTLAATLAGCPSDDPDPDGGKYYLDGLVPEAGYCKHPPLSVCDPPPNMFSNTLWYCPCVPQNICNGGNQIAACNPSTNDCRYFADSCTPVGYYPCDANATDRVLGLCGACFFIEAGVRKWDDPLPKMCNQMQLDSGVSKDTGSVKDANTMH